MQTMELPFTVGLADYEEKVSRLDKNEFFSLFEHLKAAPRWVNSAGKLSIQVLGLCHHGENHSAVFDPETLKVTCFSDCGRGMMLHTYVKQALDLDYAQAAKDLIERWIDGQDFDLSSRDAQDGISFGYCGRAFDPAMEIEMVQGIAPAVLADLYSRFDTSPETLARLRWHTEDKIPVEQLTAFQVAYYPEHGTVILPHHNANGEIVGLYERSYGPLCKEVERLFREWGEDTCDPDIRRQIFEAPRAKYMPLLKDEKYRTDKKLCWSFQNIRNLYGLHRAKEAIRQTGKAIIFEGGKSVMLAHAYGYPYAVASHTFGAHENHIAMLIQAGAKEIVLAFDRQYRDLEGLEWELYEKKTRGLAQSVGAYVKISRICDKGDLLQYKDAPIDRGKEVFEKLFDSREVLTV